MRRGERRRSALASGNYYVRSRWKLRRLHPKLQGQGATLAYHPHRSAFDSDGNISLPTKYTPRQSGTHKKSPMAEGWVGGACGGCQLDGRTHTTNGNAGLDEMRDGMGWRGVCRWDDE
ncbi:hypothetical protein LX32DRAFT_18886 [Colletotrichum zoysiae]|uniref:Uncharacterized protein n=1 Tax=Colletotrichum zoysiae TaxID=1216348 RepID=A0AAD9LZD2_9PEZI|nr:hypothetical protein LX32DRAFT_18886 [Colletotrichum zoysiae]